MTPHLLAQINLTSPSTRFNTHVGLVGNFVTLILVYSIAIAGLWFLVRLLLAGFNFLTSFGEPAKIDKARFDLLHALMGLIIVLSTFFIGQIIKVVFGINFL